MKMALNSELLITLQQLKGFGNKTILELSKALTAKTIDDLCEEWQSLRGKKYAKVTELDLRGANQIACRIIEASEFEGIGIISYFEDIFPEILKTCVDENGKLNPPIVLYYRGDIKALNKPGIAVIGTREPTFMGTKAGIFFASELAKKGFNIVSGLAVGCDTTGHEGALSVGGTTTAFLANSLAWNDIYPQANVELAHRIVENGGLLVSEYPLGYKGGKYAFISRDRLQAGLSYATLVVQTGEKGGTMHAVML
jgi:DNA processing protein